MFGVYGFGFQGLRFRVYGFGLRVSGFWVWGFKVLKVQSGSGKRSGFQILGFRLPHLPMPQCSRGDRSGLYKTDKTCLPGLSMWVSPLS